MDGEDGCLNTYQKEVVENAVRAVYRYTAMADIASRNGGEAFTVPYDLPNDTNYSETCASIGLTEKNHVKPVRQKWFFCACCPPNIARLLSSLEQYIYTYKENIAYIHLYIGAKATWPLTEGSIQINQEGNYPWDSKMMITMEATDNGKYLNNITIAEDANITESFEENLLGGCVTISADAYREEITTEKEEIYTSVEIEKKKIRIKTVPYFLWNNRRDGELQVWIRRK